MAGNEAVRAERATLSTAEVHVLQGLGFWPFIDSGDAVRKPLLEFLKRQIG